MAVRSLLLAAFALLPALAAPAAFVPELAGADVAPEVVRPGQPVRLALRFRNAGDRAADRDYRVFVHFEDPVQGCDRIVWQYDHNPLEPAPFWMPGDVVLDGPYAIGVPEEVPPGTYQVHVGLFSPDGRALDTVAGRVTVDRDAPANPPAGPAPLEAGEAAQRLAALAGRAGAGPGLQGDGFTFHIDPESGAWSLADDRGGATWVSNPLRERLGRLILRRGDERQPVLVRGLTVASAAPGSLALEQPIALADGTATGLTLRVLFAATAGPPAGLDVRYETRGESDWSVEQMRLLDDALVTTESTTGRTVLPYRLGRSLTAASDLPTAESLLTYGPATMQMMTVEQGGAALLVTWDDVDVTCAARLAWVDEPALPGRRVIMHSLDLSNQARGFTLHPLGKGTYAEAARAYRDVAERAGWRVTRTQQRAERPQIDAMAGAADFKPFVLVRTVPSSRYSDLKEERISLGYTFNDTAELAKHWRNDLEIDKAFVVLAGWIHRGYDNQHPDILPAAPECGGNGDLAAAGWEIEQLGYPFGLHDNYQDMYEDAPSWDPAMLRKNPAGEPMRGGNWAGGQAWQVRPHDQIALAKRNLPDVRRLFSPSIYFIDTTFAWGLVDSHYPPDRWSRADDMRLKQELCRYARSEMELFGSEEGREWAVPVADYLEGLLGHKYDTQPGQVAPVFLMAYHDCVNTYTHQSTRIGPDDDKHVLDTLIYAEMPLYRFGGPRYWATGGGEVQPVTVSVDARPAGPRAFDITYTWTPNLPPTAGEFAFVHFTQAGVGGENIAFQDDHALPQPMSRWVPGTPVVEGPRRVEIPDGQTGEFLIELGVLDDQRQRVSLAMEPAGNLRYRVGRITVADDGTVAFQPLTPGEQGRPFAANAGWSRGLAPTDRFIKNTYEVLSYTHRAAFERPFNEHSVDGRVERTTFGDDLRIVANYGEQPAVVETGDVLGRVVLPQHGFAVWSPEFVAVHATEAAGRRYPTPVLFTARSLDEQPLANSAQVRLYHGFGGPALALGGKVFEVEREAVVALR